MSAVLAILALCEVVGAFMYLAVPVYFDHFEPLIPSIASAWLNGSPIYAPLSSSTIYGVVYGPLVFQFCAIGLKLLGANVFSSKIMFVGAFVIASLATYSSIRLRGISLRIALFTTSAMLVTYGAFGHFPFWTRPDPILTLVSSLGILVMSTASLSRLPRILLVASLTGMACDLKLHGALYLLPPLLLLVSEEKPKSRLVRIATLSGIVLSITVVMPFMIPPSQVSQNIVSYLVYLHLTAKHGLSAILLVKNLIFIFSIAGVLLLVSRSCASLDPEIRKLSRLCFGCSVLTALVSSKPGAGAHHLFPYLPLAALIMATIVHHRQPSKLDLAPSRKLTVILATAFVLSFGMFVGDWPDYVQYYFHRNAIAKAQAEIETAIRDPRAGVVEVGIGEPSTLNRFIATMRVFPIFAKQPLLFDEGSWEDMQMSGVDPAITLKILEDCRVETWLIPGDAPWTKDNEYYANATPMFSRVFVERFERNYTLLRTSSGVGVWRCNK